ncbi:hypothetical protein BJ508DRAFT_417000 [Ascobolus immersus RN42]|uniref:FabD/lysophospholipase-like protein n=1 Tax=Ascobolus immersus RN42 TaxID=1160509 RepID=A0A3N4I0B5_ASCIM|nr:hypothetical protein BJ508DRAFT_417000 [Ascobolus immersus RN42]
MSSITASASSDALLSHPQRPQRVIDAESQYSTSVSDVDDDEPYEDDGDNYEEYYYESFGSDGEGFAEEYSDDADSTIEIDDESETSSAGGRPPLICENCTKEKPALFYCNVCKCDFCEGCWNNFLPHRKQGEAVTRGDPRHEKTNKKLAQTIDGILYPRLTPEEFRKLHRKDRHTMWFGVRRDYEKQEATDSSKLVITKVTSSFANTDRLQKILGPACNDNTPRYPSIASFVGETGAGKSTLIKAFIEISSLEESNIKSSQSPVVRSNEDSTRPCSGDVHLYADPRSIGSTMPILFADCEGIRGGNRTPMAMRACTSATPKDQKKGTRQRLKKSFKKTVKSAGKGAGNIGFKLRRLAARGMVARQMSWTTNKQEQTREYAVEKIYPRFLYAFSDTIVFVVRNPNTFEAVIVQLIEWAESAIEYSANQPTLPSALIIFNAVDNTLHENYWDPQNRTAAELESINEILTKSAKIQKWVEKWAEERDKTITTIEQLILAYYSDIKVIAVPERGRTELINQQIKRVYQEIQEMGKSALIRKREAHMCLTYHRLLPYLNAAFEHFACSNKAFNFVDVSFRENPIPEDFGGGVQRLLMAMWEHRKKDSSSEARLISEKTIIDEASDMIASAILLNSTRSRHNGSAKLLFPHYLRHIQAAFNEFQANYYPCEFVKESRQRFSKSTRPTSKCAIVRSRHSKKRHQTAEGTIIGTGDFCSELEQSGNAVSFFQKTFDYIYGTLQVFLEQLKVETSDTGQGGDYSTIDREVVIAGDIHMDLVLAPFVKMYKGLKSNALCLGCVVEKPKYPLRCGHSICETCLRCFGTTNDLFHLRYTLSYCPICGDDKPRHNVPVEYRLFPREASPCVLSLDGGGVRGIVQLEALKQIELAIGLQVPIREFFDLIVGTSCGGIIALGLAVNHWPVEKCYSKFETFCESAFQVRASANVPGFRKAARFLHRSGKYQTLPLEATLEDNFGDSPLFGHRTLHQDQENGRFVAVAVTATTLSHELYVFGNYNRKEIPGMREQYHFFRPLNPESEFLVWQAARATSAAPTYFKAYEHAPSRLLLIDGALRSNNPVEVAIRESRALASGPGSNNCPDILLSIGTGYIKEGDEPKGSNILDRLPPLWRATSNVMNHALDTRREWNRFDDAVHHGSDHDIPSNRFKFRLDLKLQSKVKIDDYAAIPQLKKEATEEFERNPKVAGIANRLIASLFYFHIESIEDGGSRKSGISLCKGFIRCRLQYEQCCQAKLADKFDRRLPGAHFVVEWINPTRRSRSGTANSNSPSSSRKTQIPLNPEEFANLCKLNNTKCMWQLPIEFEIPSAPDALIGISLATESGDLGMLSAFPRRLSDEYSNRQRGGIAAENSLVVNEELASVISQEGDANEAEKDELGHRRSETPVYQAFMAWKPPRYSEKSVKQSTKFHSNVTTVELGPGRTNRFAIADIGNPLGRTRDYLRPGYSEDKKHRSRSRTRLRKKLEVLRNIRSARLNFSSGYVDGALPSPIRLFRSDDASVVQL